MSDKVSTDRISRTRHSAPLTKLSNISAVETLCPPRVKLRDPAADRAV